MDISPGPPFWRIIPDDMDIPLLDHLALSGRPDADFHGAGVNFVQTEFSEVRELQFLRSSHTDLPRNGYRNARETVAG
jgi:hypothetical protein